jgi:hypothetical protein
MTEAEHQLREALTFALEAHLRQDDEVRFSPLGRSTESIMRHALNNTERTAIDIPDLAHWLWSETWDGEWHTQWDGPRSEYIQSHFEGLAKRTVQKLGLNT